MRTVVVVKSKQEAVTMATFLNTVCFIAVASCAVHAQTAERLRVEYLTNPITVDVSLPRFSWSVAHPARGQTQSAYRIIVSLLPQAQIVWNSGKVASNQTVNIQYAGAPLSSDSDYTWSLQWWDSNNSGSAVATASFSTALLAGVQDGQGAVWIQPAPGANTLRAEFVLPATPARARLYISGMGYYHSFLNGAATDDHIMGPFTTFERTMLYDAWDVTQMLRQGCNALAVSLGVGWYNQSSIKSGPKSLWAMLSVDTPTAGPGSQLNRTYYITSLPGSSPTTAAATAGSAVQPLYFTSAPGPVVFDEIYLGESYDARLEQPGWAQCNFFPAKNSSIWAPAQLARDATANATFAAHHVQIRVDRPYSPVAITQPISGVWVADFGQNMAGILQTAVTCPAGPTTLSYLFGESLNEDGTVYNQYDYPYPLIQTANYTCAGTGDLESYTTQFSQYGFRFVQVRNFPGIPNEGSFTAYFIHSDVGQSSSFSSNSADLNVVQHMTRFASLSNLMDVPTDCPQRERRGWLGDAQLSWETVAHNFDAAAFYTKWLRDVADAQAVYMPTRQGQVPDCAPFYGHGGLPADPGWSVAYPLIVNWMYEYMADDRIVAQHYAGLKAFVDSEVTQANPNGTLTWSRYGDWCSVSSGFNTSAHFQREDISTWEYWQAASIVAKLAGVVGNNGDAQRYGQLAADTAQTYNNDFLHVNAQPQGGVYYSDGYPVSQVIALASGLVPAAHSADVASTLVLLLNNGTYSGYANAPTGGIIFQKYAHDVLTKSGRVDLALELLLHKGFPGILYWTEQAVPATTLWENWQSTSTHAFGSYNHIMYGGYGGWLYWGVAGLGRAAGVRGWSSLTLTPPSPSLLAPYLTQASASVDTAVGQASVAWDAAPDPCTTPGSSCTCGLFEEYHNVTLTCADGGVFDGCAFASYGYPTGSCTGGFTPNATCDSPNAAAIVAGFCAGQTSCTLPVSDAFFNVAPCAGTGAKHLAVVMDAGQCATVLYTLHATVPTNAQAAVTVHLPRAGATVLEGGVPVWVKGAFLPGAVPGVSAAALASDGQGVVFQLGGGTYSFATM